MQLKDSDLEEKAQGQSKIQREQLLVVLRETRHNKTTVHFILYFSGQAKLTEALQGFYVEAQMENVSS